MAEAVAAALRTTASPVHCALTTKTETTQPVAQQSRWRAAEIFAVDYCTDIWSVSGRCASWRGRDRSTGGVATSALRAVERRVGPIGMVVLDAVAAVGHHQLHFVGVRQISRQRLRWSRPRHESAVGDQRIVGENL